MRKSISSVAAMGPAREAGDPILGVAGKAITLGRAVLAVRFSEPRRPGRLNHHDWAQPRLWHMDSIRAASDWQGTVAGKRRFQSHPGIQVSTGFRGPETQTRARLRCTALQWLMRCFCRA